jgi:hypothetical protein
MVFCKLSRDVIKQIKDLPNFIHYSNITEQELINHYFANYVKGILYRNYWIYRIFPETTKLYREYCDKFLTNYETKLDYSDNDLCKKHQDYDKFKEFYTYIKSFDLKNELGNCVTEANNGILDTLIKTKLKYDNNSYN